MQNLEDPTPSDESHLNVALSPTLHQLEELAPASGSSTAELTSAAASSDTELDSAVASTAGELTLPAVSGPEGKDAAQNRFASPKALSQNFRSQGGTLAYTEVTSLTDEATRTLVRAALLEALGVARQEAAEEPVERPVRRRRLSKSSCRSESSSASASVCRRSTEVDLWLPAALAAALPLMAGSLPRDQRGLCVIPHPHEMKQERACRRDLVVTETGNVAYNTRRACDNCDRPIEGRFWYSCITCEVDFCLRCHNSLKELFAGMNMGNASWSASFVASISTFVLSASSREEREALIRILAFEWPVVMFEQLVQTVADVADAKIVHVQDGDGCDLAMEAEFWHVVGFLQLLHAANLLPGRELRFGELCLRGPRIPLERFVLGAIDKCDAQADLNRWKSNCSADTSLPCRMVLEASSFCVSKEFAVFLAHGALVPIGFRQRCLQHDVNAVIGERHGQRRWRRSMKLRVPRDPAALCQAVVEALGNESADLATKLAVSFQGEQGEGPGVVREFLCLAMQSLLDGSPRGATAGPWEYDPNSRTYWFREPLVEWPESLRACGALIGHALVAGSFLQVALPQAIYAHLLRSLGSEQPADPTLADLALVRPELAKGLQQLIDFEGDNVADVFPLDWPAASRLEDPEADRKEYVNDYVRWFFLERFASQLSPLAEGFKAVLGRSMLLRSLIDATQFEQILCGAEAPLDVEALRRGAEVKGWLPDDAEYMNGFWDVIREFNSAEQRRFIVFVSSCARMPPQGWQDLALQVQKHGRDDARLPTAYTCFTLLLLPRYSSADVLRARLHAAIMETEGFGLS